MKNMKIIDTHTHLPGCTFGGQPRPAADLRREFEAEGLTGAWLFTTDGLIKETDRNNDILAEAVEGHRDFFVPFCTVNPHDGAGPAIREVERAKSKLGMKGIKFHSWLQAFSLTHPAVLPILQAAGDLKMPVIFHDGTPPYSTPLQIASAAEKVPHTTIVLGHAGLDDLYRDAILACRRQPNVYLCCCSNSAGIIDQLIKSCPPDRLLFGSDGGFGTDLIRLALEKIADLQIPPAIQARIFHDNAQDLIHL